MGIDFNAMPPSTWADNLARNSLGNLQKQLDTQTKAAKARGDALGQLQKALQDYKGSLTSLTGKKSLSAMSATATPDGAATVSAKGNAQAGNYSVFVEQLASSQQLLMGELASATAKAGDKFTIKLAGGDSFTVALDGVDKDGDGKLTPSELALAINRADGNAGKVNAMVLTNNGVSQLVLSAGKSGEKNAISLDLGGVTDAGLKAGLSAPKELSKAQDAIAWMGGKGAGVRLQQGSNTFDNIEGVSFTVNKLSKDGDPPLQLSIGRSDSDTNANVQSFVDAYNKIYKAISDLSQPGSSGKPGAAFADDSSVRALKSQLNTILRQSYDGITLGKLGISASRDGTLTLDSKKLGETLKAAPDALDRYFNGAGQDGALKQSSDYLDKWLNYSNGLLKQRRDSGDRQQKDLDRRQDALQKQYEATYQRYLAQFTKLQSMQDQMTQTMGMFNFN
ncbi:flagellar filament capping protein FliD [Chromobacterium sp. IIBBL 290-4]|uniref:flagellar filament capping protein FliD n=1 Tax=Chromobacterium sp. IIBBL 290-4 TaxID=2953890 RepID=UPI0020B8E522|nr:flagellar filament capping protein FliD [Chromobacterium sp. IIBBL 290-4]UTH73150.1 flagellar filament capping protein FliD [Chromobacterium sp. IIBBL 290-4]